MRAIANKKAMIKLIQRIWKDPVWSKVIAVGIIASITLIWATIRSLTSEVTFSETLQGLFNIKMRLVYILGAILVYISIKSLFKKKGPVFSKQQLQIMKNNKFEDKEKGIIYMWKVIFSNGIPSPEFFRPYCAKHDNLPLPFNLNGCPLSTCVNSSGIYFTHNVKKQIETELINEWVKINSRKK